jgi:hypothetical protein
MAYCVYLVRKVRLGLILFALSLSACGHTREVELRFGHDFDCHEDVSVKQVSESTFMASGCDEQATYTCVGPPGGTSTCVREYTDRDMRRMSAPAPAPVAESSSGAGPGRVEREFDEQRKLHVVKVHFKAGRLGADIMFLGAPERELTAVYLKVWARGNQSMFKGCNSLRVLVNDEPFDGQRVNVQWSDKKWRAEASGVFEFEHFKPLGRKYATFGIDLCGQRLPFAEGQLVNMTKFLEIFSQIAVDAQAKQGSGTQPAASHAEEPALQL